MANTLLITKQTGNFFDYTLNGDTSKIITNDQNRLQTTGNVCHFKTGNGANVIQEQDITYDNVSVLASGVTYTFLSVDDMWTRLINVGFFDGTSSGGGGGGGGVSNFDDLNDTFQYIGQGGEVVIVNATETGLTTVPFNNISAFIELSDVQKPYLADKMVVVNSAGDGLIYVDIPTIPDTIINTIGWFSYQNSLGGSSFSADTTLQLTNDGDGDDTVLTYAPYGVPQMWNSVTNSFDFSYLSVGDVIDIRIDANVTTLLPDQKYQMSIIAGYGTLKERVFEFPLHQYRSVSAFTDSYNITLAMNYSEWLTNPCPIFITSDGPGVADAETIYIRAFRQGVNLTSISGVTEAPIDGQRYVRLNGNWATQVVATVGHHPIYTYTGGAQTFIISATAELGVVVLNEGRFLLEGIDYTRLGTILTIIYPLIVNDIIALTIFDIT